MKKPPLLGRGFLILCKHIFNSKAPPRRTNDHADNNVDEENFDKRIHNVIY